MNWQDLTGVAGMFAATLGLGHRSPLRFWIGQPRRTWLKAEKEFDPMFHGLKFCKTSTELKAKLEERAVKCEAEAAEWQLKGDAAAATVGKDMATVLAQDNSTSPNPPALTDNARKAKQAMKTLAENAATLRTIARNLDGPDMSYELTLDEVEYLGF